MKLKGKYYDIKYSKKDEVYVVTFKEDMASYSREGFESLEAAENFVLNVYEEYLKDAFAFQVNATRSLLKIHDLASSIKERAESV